jgi:glycosyltransferase involved in cell wall biosynthesis
MPSVSVVIPVKDDAALLRRCLRALAHQSIAPDEIIVVDNGSSDDSVAVAEEAGARVLTERVKGIAAASATGYDAARGEIVARLDADCVPGADWVKGVVEAFADDPTVGAITGGARLVDGPRSLRRVLPVVYLGAYHAALTPALGHPPLLGSNMAMRRAAWAAVSGRVHRDDRLMHDDLDVAFHLGEHHRIRYVRALPMGISGRPFNRGAAFGLRVRRGFHTVFAHWPEQFPPRRWSGRRIRRDAVGGNPDPVARAAR